MGPDAVGAIYTDATGRRGGGAALGDLFAQGEWSKLEKREGANWQELRALKTALESRCDLLSDKLVLVRMDNSTAVA